MGTIKQVLDEALSLDSDGHTIPAYSKYLEAVSAIVQKLGESKQVSHEEGTLSVPHAARLFKMMRNCIDRAEAALASASASTAPTAPSSTAQSSGPAPKLESLSSSTSSLSLSRSSVMSSGDHHSMSGSAAEHRTASSPLPLATSPASLISRSSTDNGFARTPTAASPTPSVQSASGSLSEIDLAYEPVRQAQKRNKEILRAYQARMANLTGAARSSMQTTLMRTLTENMQLAKEKQQSIIAQMEQRKAHLLQVEAMHQQQADAALQDAETELTKLAKTRPQDFDGFFRLATSLLRSASHPIGAFLADSLRAFADSFPESGADSLCGHPLEEIDATVSMAEARVHSIALRVHGMLTKRFPDIERNEALNARSIAMVEDAVFGEAHGALLAYYRVRHAQSDAALAAAALAYAEATPVDLGIRTKFCLMPQEEEEFEPEDTPRPYQKAIDTLARITDDVKPSEKAARIAQVAQEIVDCVNEFWALRGMDTSTDAMAVGCDDLLPIMAYVLIKACPAYIRSQSAFVREFMNESATMGAEGYSFATLETALDYLETLDLSGRL